MTARDQVIDGNATNDEDTPYSASVKGQVWKIRMNDFPDEHLFTLLVDGRAVEDFDDWPTACSQQNSPARRYP
ncbi:MAG TPA: hypothetical protein VGN17_11760 [Bryobacteraceae bacterium]|jgi:hypothetical protein